MGKLLDKRRPGGMLGSGYDAAGNMTPSRPIGHGNLPAPATELTPRRRRARPREVKSGATTVAKFEYDGLNRRIKKHIDSEAPGAPDGVDTYRHFYYNNAWQVVETRKSTAENTDPEELQPEVQYVWSLRYIDAPVLREKNTHTDDLCDDQTLYYLTDANMNVTCLVDTGGDAVERYNYTPYGTPIVRDADWTLDADGTDYDNTILYAGYRHDPETGLYHVRRRYLHPTLGRWVSRDPIGYADGMNLYEYGAGAPTVAGDPTGLAVDPGKDCKLHYMDKRRPWPNPKLGETLQKKRAWKPKHAWLAEGDLGAIKTTIWDFGPDRAYMNARFGKGNWSPSTCSWGTFCKGQKDYRDKYYSKSDEDAPEFDATALKLKWDWAMFVNTLKAGAAAGKTCQCATCADIKACLQAVEDEWQHKTYEYVWQSCVSFAHKAMDQCCLRK